MLNKITDTDLQWLRDQLDTLAVGADRPSAPQTAEQWRRCLQGMLRGEDWQHRAWQ